MYSRVAGTIGKYFGIGESGVSQARWRISQKIDNDRKLKKKIEKIEKKLKLSKMNGLLPKSLFALSKAFFDKYRACSRCFQNSPFGLKQLKALIFRFAKIYLQKSALMTA